MIKCPQCGSIQIMNFNNNNNTYDYLYCRMCECKFKIEDGDVKIINKGKEILLG